MYRIGEYKMFLRAHAELPASFKLATEVFREGWDLVQATNTERLRKKTLMQGWSFVKFDDGLLQGGVGETSQFAIASAVKLALRHVSEDFDAAGIEHIELTQYPWFFLASIRVCPYIIQQNAVLPIHDDAAPLAHALRSRRCTAPSAPYPHLVRAVPELRELLAVRHGDQASERLASADLNASALKRLAS